MYIISLFFYNLVKIDICDKEILIDNIKFSTTNSCAAIVKLSLKMQLGNSHCAQF